MNAQEMEADQTGDGSNRGALLNEPCRFCHKVGGVWFVIDDSPFGKNSSQACGCSLCGANWDADSPVAR